MMETKLVKFYISIFFLILASRLIPHPPNFTNLISIAFYIPCLFGIRFIWLILAAMIVSDSILGFHSTIPFTLFSVFLIGLFSKLKFFNLQHLRIFGSLLSALLFFIITNFGVWLTSDLYINNLSGLIQCYILAIPFLNFTLLSTLIYSVIIELLVLIKNNLNSKKLKKF